MTDDELDRALFSLPLEEAPADLHSRIMAGTLLRPRLTFSAWEVWLVGTLVACAVWLTFMVATSVPDLSGAISRAVWAAVDAIGTAFSINTLMWVALGASFVLWISQLTLPPRRTTAGR
jgi:hypothetical protein